MLNGAYLFSLVFLLVRFTRGFEGIPVVCDFTLEKWSVFESDFDGFCKALVSHCEAVCKGTCISQLSHREGFHTIYSGIHFIRTLKRADCRKRIKKVAEIMKPVVSRLLRLRGRTQLTVSEIIALGNSMCGFVALAVRKGRVKMAGKYNAMDCARCFMAVCERILRCRPAEYVQVLHNWFLTKQSKKYRDEACLRYFGALSCDGMTRAIARMRASLSAGASVCAATMQILYCETRQAINKYTIGGVCYLLERFDMSRIVRHHVSRVRARLQSCDDVSTPHTLQLLETIRKQVGMMMQELRKQHPRRMLSVSDLAHKVGRLRICPKVVLEGIPEWNVLSRCMMAVVAKVKNMQRSASYQDVKQAARSMGITYYNAGGSSKKTRKVLLRQLAQKMKAPQGTGMKKRSFAELEQLVKAAGGQPLWYATVRGRRKRCRMSREAMEAYLDG